MDVSRRGEIFFVSLPNYFSTTRERDTEKQSEKYTLTEKRQRGRRETEREQGID